jgi:hypothetical protein
MILLCSGILHYCLQVNEDISSLKPYMFQKNWCYWQTYAKVKATAIATTPTSLQVGTIHSTIHISHTKQSFFKIYHFLSHISFHVLLMFRFPKNWYFFHLGTVKLIFLFIWVCKVSFLFFMLKLKRTSNFLHHFAAKCWSQLTKLQVN